MVDVHALRVQQVQQGGTGKHGRSGGAEQLALPGLVGTMAALEDEGRGRRGILLAAQGTGGSVYEISVSVQVDAGGGKFAERPPQPGTTMTGTCTRVKCVLASAQMLPELSSASVASWAVSMSLEIVSCRCRSRQQGYQSHPPTPHVHTHTRHTAQDTCRNKKK